jgi:hypothetical protein
MAQCIIAAIQDVTSCTTTTKIIPKPDERVEREALIQVGNLRCAAEDVFKAPQSRQE